MKITRPIKNAPGRRATRSGARTIDPGRILLTVFGAFCFQLSALADAEHRRPHIILVMADDMGWGQTGYRGHPLLKTPGLDAMAASGLRFDRFYAGGPVCSPTRASVLTGRSHDRTGVLSHGYALRLQEKTLSQALRKAGYRTGHFGKWHLNGHRGPGAPIFASDPRNPGAFGFDNWLSVSNFYDLNPLMSRQGSFEELRGDSSEIVVAEAIRFLRTHRDDPKPMCAVIWYGTPHSPFRALERDTAAFGHLKADAANHYGELVAMDRSVAALRSSLKELGLAENTLLVFCSDNGGLPGIEPPTTGGLRGHKGTVYEGGLRVPAIMEWPGVIQPRVTEYPACVMDLFPTVAEIVGLPAADWITPQDGVSLLPLFSGRSGARDRPIGFRYQKQRALVSDRFKLLTTNFSSGSFELYDLLADPEESQEVSQLHPDVLEQMKRALVDWDASVERSFSGLDYPARAVIPPDPAPVNWYELPEYQDYLDDWQQRWEYQRWLRRTAPARPATPKKQE